MIWLDAHLSPRIARWISCQFALEARPLRDLNLREADDDLIWAEAARERAVLLTKDSDFADRVKRLGPPPWILLLTCGNTSEARLKHILAVQLADALAMLDQGEPLVEIQ